MFLVVCIGDRRRSVRLLGGTWFLGRSPENDLVLDDESIQGVQANLTRSGEGWKLVNLDPSTPLLRGEEVLRAAMVRDGDVFQLGKVTLEFRSQEDSVSSSTGRSSTGVSTLIELAVEPRESDWVGRDRTLRLVADLASVIAAGDDPEEVLDRTLVLLKRGFGDKASRALIATVGEDLDDIEVRRSIDFPGREQGTSCAFDMSRTLLHKVLREHRALLSTDTSTDRSLGTASIDRLGIRSLLAVPILYADRLLGLIYLDTASDHEPFTRPDLELLTLVAMAVGAMLENAQLARTLAQENQELQDRIAADSSFITSCREMDQLLRDLVRVARTDATVLIIGESGTGKELAATTIHRNSPRGEGPFVAVNCAAIPETLIESELFGYAPRSGISGSDPAGKPGKFELADGGSIFLDEIGDMSLATQAKLLRVLEERALERLGSTSSTQVDVRVIAATNKNLHDEVTTGTFRQDLYFRLNEIEIPIPPLRRRKEEILPLAMHFARLATGHEVEIVPEARETLLAYPWPGNVRELKGCIRNAVILGDGQRVTARDLPERIRKGKGPGLRTSVESLAQMERRHIVAALRQLGANKESTARALGIARDTLYRKLRRYEIKPEEYEG